MLSVIFILP